MRRDLPTIDATTKPFWEACGRGVLLFNRCRACAHAYAYPRPFCPECWSDDVGWEEASGAGRLYTWSTVYQNDLPPFAEQVPYVAAIVDLAEGPRLMTRITDCESEDLQAGMEVEVVFVTIADDVVVPWFRPVAAR